MPLDALCLTAAVSYTHLEVHSITLLPEHDKETARGPPVGLQTKKGLFAHLPSSNRFQVAHSIAGVRAPVNRFTAHFTPCSA